MGKFLDKYGTKTSSESGDSKVGKVLKNIKEHPVKAVLQPISVTMGGRSPKEVINEKVQTQMDREALSGDAPWLQNYLRAYAAGMAGDVVNFATTPASYIPIPAGKVAAKIMSKIPAGKGLSLLDVATKAPVGPGFREGIAYQQKLATMAPLSSRGVKVLNPEEKIIQALSEAKPIRGKQEAIYSVERSKRAAQISEIGKNVPGEQGFHAQLGALKGELPKVNYESIRGQIAQPDIDGLFNQIEGNDTLLPFEKITAKNGLSKLLGAEGGAVPTEGELSKLGQVFSPDFMGAVLEKRPMMQKVFATIGDAVNVPRAIMATADLSAPLRQGLFLIGRPKQWIPAFKDMFKYAFSEKAYDGLMQDISKRPTFKAMKDAGLSLTEVAGKIGPMTAREETFMSNLVEKIPVFGDIAKGSNRAYVGFLNKLRADVFDDIYKKADALGVLKTRPNVANDIATFVNSATGRGKLPDAINRASVVLNGTLFSPKLLASRMNLLNPAYYVKLDPMVRKEALKSLLTLGGTALTTLGLAKMSGANVVDDPRNADFGKIKVGDTRYDILGGFQQPIVLAARVISGQMISSTTGKEFTLGEGYKPMTRLGIAGKFIGSKLNPIASFAVSLAEGQNARGEGVDVPVEIVERFLPMVVQDMYDLYKEKGPKGLAQAFPGAFGVGVQTYGNDIPTMTTTPSGNPKVKWVQKPGMAQDIVNTFRDKEVSNIPQEMWADLKDKRRRELLQTSIKESEKKKSMLTPEEHEAIIKDAEGIVKPALQALSHDENFQSLKPEERQNTIDEIINNAGKIAKKRAIERRAEDPRRKMDEYLSKKTFGQSSFMKKYGKGGSK